MINKPHRFGANVLLWIFVASGFAGLVYQSIWTQYLGLILGHSAYAQVLVLALFMGGMALGAWLVSLRSEWLRKPLMIYAIIEAVIGIFGIVFNGFYQYVSDLSYSVIFPLLPSGLPLEIGRWTIASLLILPQCILLGATFPLMSAGYIRWRPDASGKVLAGLYFTNSLGAAIGALASTYLLLPSVGLPGTVLTAGLINFGVALIVWPLAKQEQPHVPEPERSERTHFAAPRLVLWAAAITGASSFVYEIVWVRMLSMVLGSTIHAFEIMLSSFIAGIAFGGLWLRSRADGLKSPLGAAGWAQIAMGVMALSTLFFYNNSFEWIAWLLQTLNRQAESAYSFYNVASAVISMIVMFPAAFFAGMTLPLFTLTLLRQGGGERAIGRVYAVNTLGAITGVVITIYWLIPVLGLRVALWLAATTDIVLGLILLFVIVKRRQWLSQRIVWITSVACVVIMGLSLTMTSFDLAKMNSGVYRYGRIDSSGQEILFHKDGRTATVAIKKITRHGEPFLNIVTNGKPDAAIGMNNVMTDERTMANLAVLPMLFFPEARNIGVIGFGSGLSTHMLLGNPELAQVDTIEIEPAMIEAARFFGDKVKRAFEDPRSNIVIDDAKSYFSTNRKKYDIIISEPSNPWVSGVASLFTEEFYRFVPEHLSPDGLFVQWLQLYEIRPQLVSSVIRSMAPYFDDIQFFLGDQVDMIIIASPKKKLLPLEQLTIPKIWSDELRQEMAMRGIRDEQDLRTFYLGDKNVLEVLANMYAQMPKNSDFFPILQLEAPRDRFKEISSVVMNEAAVAAWPILETITGRQPHLSGYVIDVEASEILASLKSLINARGLKSLLLDSNSTDPYVSKLTLYLIALAGDLKRSASQCFDDHNYVNAIDELTVYASSTISFFQPKDLEDLWIKPTWLDCVPQNILVRDYFAFLKASAKRDHQEMVDLGEHLLSNEVITARVGTLSYILGGVELAALALKDHEKAIDLEKKYSRYARPDEMRRFIVTLAEMRSLMQSASNSAVQNGAAATQALD